MEEKTIIGPFRVSLPSVKKGELSVTESEVLFFKRGSLFSSRSIVKRLPVSSISGIQPGEHQELKIEVVTESGGSITETISFEYKAEAESVLKHLRECLQEQIKKKKEEEEAEARRKEEERAHKKEAFRKYIGGTLSHIWSITSNLFKLCTAIPQAEWDNIKEISGALEERVESFFKLIGLDRDKNIPNFKELAEKEQLADLEKGAAYLLQYLSGLVAKGPPSEAPAPVDGQSPPAWPELKYFFLYTALLNETGLLIELDEPGEIFDIGAKLELLTPIIKDKFGFIKDDSLAPSLRLPKKREEATGIYKKLVGEIDAYWRQWGEGQT